MHHDAHPLDILTIRDDDAERIFPAEICTLAHLELYYLQRLGVTLASIPVILSGPADLLTIEHLLDALEAADRRAFDDILIVPHSGGFVVATHMERDGVGNFAIQSFRQHAATEAERRFAKVFTVHALRTQILRQEWLAAGGGFHALPLHHPTSATRHS